MVKTMASLEAFSLLPPPSCMVSRLKSLPFRTPAMQASSNLQAKQILIR